jgi:polar amino acid transport system substrate-binding protein
MAVGYLLAEEQPPLRVGMELSYPPFEMVCRDGKPCGISVEFAEALGKFLHREVQIENISYVGLIPSLNTGKIDLIISSLTVSPQREKAIDFSEPYLTTGLCLLVSARSDLQNISEANAPGRVIVVKSGTTGEVYALKNLKKATVRVLDKESLCVLEVVQGKADAFIYDQFSVKAHAKKHPITTRAILTPFATENWAVGIKKGNTQLREQVNAFITEFKANGGFEALKAKYEEQLPEEKEATENA